MQVSHEAPEVAYMMQHFVLTLFVVLALSGCVGSEGTPGGAANIHERPQFDDTTGALKVLITDDELAPIANATVGVTPTSPEEGASPVEPLMTSDAGHAVFSSLTPGSYNVQVVALGFASAAKNVDVRVGEVVDVQLVIAPLPSDDPYHSTEVHRDTVQSVLWRVGPACDTVVQPPLGTCLGFQYNDVTFYRVLAEDWATIVDEATWTPNTAASHQRAYVFATFPNVTDFSGVPDFKSPGHFEAAGPNPVILRIERTEIRERGFPEESQFGEGPNGRGTRFRAVNDFEDVGVPGVIGVSFMWDQAMTVYNTEFHKLVAPSDFTALPDA